jgi:DHA1 family tetracycline resistance protein-like MFS transporter
MAEPVPNARTMPPMPRQPAGPPKGALLTVFLVVFIDLLGFGIVLPLLARYADYVLPNTPIRAEYYGLVIGLLMSCFSAMQFLFAPIWGRISDRVGRRPILILGLAGSVVFYALFGYASSLGAGDAELALILMFVARLGAGIAGANISTAHAVIADCTTKEKRASGMALIGISFGIGFTFGPLLAGFTMWIAPDRLELAGYSAALLSFISWLIAIFKMPETRVVGGHGAKRNWLDFRGLLSTLNTPTVGTLVLIFFLATLGFAKFEATLGLLNKELGYTDERSNFFIFAYVGFVLMLTQGGLYRRLVKKKIHELVLMRWGVGFMFLGLIGLTAVLLATDDNSMRMFGFLISLACGVFGFAFLTPSAQALISKRSDPNRQGEVLGVNQAFSALARILGPLLGIILFKLESTHVLPYIVAALLLAIVLFLMTKLSRE